MGIADDILALENAPPVAVEAPPAQNVSFVDQILALESDATSGGTIAGVVDGKSVQQEGSLTDKIISSLLAPEEPSAIKFQQSPGGITPEILERAGVRTFDQAIPGQVSPAPDIEPHPLQPDTTPSINQGGFSISPQAQGTPKTFKEVSEAGTPFIAPDGGGNLKSTGLGDIGQAILEAPTGIIETFMALTSGLAAASGGTIAGVVEEGFGGNTKEFDADVFLKRFHKSAEDFTYQPRSETGKAMVGIIGLLFEKYNLSADKATEILIDPAKHPEAAAALNIFFKGAPLALPLLFGRGKVNPKVAEEISSGARKVQGMFGIAKEAGTVQEAQTAFSTAIKFIDEQRQGMTTKEASALRKEAFILKRKIDGLEGIKGPEAKGLHRIADQLLFKLKEIIKPGRRATETVESVNRGNKLPGRPDIKVRPRPEVEAVDFSLKPQKAHPEVRARALDSDIKARVADINDRILQNLPIGEELDSLVTVKKLQDALRRKPVEEVQSDFLRKEPAAVEPIKPDSPEEVAARAERISEAPTDTGQKVLTNINKDKKPIQNVAPEGFVGEVRNTPKQFNEIMGKRVDQIRQSTPEQLAKIKPIFRGDTVEFPGFLGKDVEGEALTEKAPESTGTPRVEGLTEGLRHKLPIQFLGDEIPFGKFAEQIVTIYDRLIAEKSAEAPRPDVIRHLEQEIIDRETAIAKQSEAVKENQERLEAVRAESAAKKAKGPDTGQLELEVPKPKKRTRQEFLDDMKKVDVDKHSLSEIVIRMGGLSSEDGARFGFERSDMVKISRLLFGPNHGNLFKNEGVPIDRLHLRLNEEFGANFADVDAFVEALRDDTDAVLNRLDDKRVKLISRNIEAEVEVAANKRAKEEEAKEAEIEKTSAEIKAGIKEVLDLAVSNKIPDAIRRPAMRATEIAMQLKYDGIADISRPLVDAIKQIAGRSDIPDLGVGMRGALKRSMEEDPHGFELKMKAYDEDMRGEGGINPVSTFVRHFGEIKQGGPLDNQIGAIDPSAFIEAFTKGGKVLAEKMFGEKLSPEKRAAFDKLETYEGFKVHERGKKKAEAHFKKTMAERLEKVEAAILSRNRPLIRKILKEAGVEGWKTIMKIDLSKKASSRTMVEVAEARRDIFDGLNPIERKHLDQMIFEKSMIGLGETNPHVSNPEGRLAEDILREHDAKRRDPVTRKEFKALEKRAEKFFATMKRQIDDMYAHELIDLDFADKLRLRRDYVRREFIEKIDPDNTSGLLRSTPGSVRDAGLKKLDKGGIGALREDGMLQLLLYISIKNNRIARNDALSAVGQHLKATPGSSIGKPHTPGEKIPFGMQEFVYLVKGKKRSMIVTNRFAEQLATSDPQMAATFTKFLSWMSGTPLVRATATAFNPAFALLNFPRDFFWQYFASLEHSPHLPIFAAQMSKDLIATRKFLPNPGDFRRDIFKGFARDMIEHGMLPHFLATEGAEEVMQLHPHLEGAVKYAEWFQYNAELWNRLAVSHRAFNNAMEKYKRAHGGQKPARGSDAYDAILQYAAWNGRSVMDFDTGGKFTKAMNNFLPYFNPGVVALRTFADRIFLKKAPAGTGKTGPTEPKTSNTRIAGDFSINDDFAIKAAWTFALGATAWYLANGDEKKREMWEQISQYEKQNFFIIPFPQADYVDENNEVRHAYVRIAKSHEARPFLTLIEGIMDKQAGREFDIQNVVDAANSAIALFPEQSVGVPLYNATVALANFDTWTNKEIWSQLGGPVLPESEVKYDTNEFLTSLAKTDMGKRLKLSPARTQTAISKLLVPTNPGVMVMGELMSGLAIAGGAELSQRSVKDDFPSLSRRFPFLERVFRYTQPVKAVDKKDFLKGQQGINIKNLERKRLIKYHLQNEKNGQKEDILDNLIDLIEDTQEQDAIRSDVDKRRIQIEREKEGFESGLSQLRLLAKPGVNPKARAGQAFRMWKRMTPEGREAFEDDLRDHGGIWSDAFADHYYRLTDNFNSNNIK